MNHIIRPALYNSYHKIINASDLATDNLINVRVCGNICENGDIFGKDRKIQNP